MCAVKDAELDDAYVQGYLDGLDDLDDYEMVDGGVNGIGAFDLSNFPTMLVFATVANTIASKDELLNLHLDKLSFLQDKETKAVKKEYRGGLKILVAGLGVMYSQNEIVQAAALGVGISGANDLYEYAKEQKMFGLAGVGSTAYQPQTQYDTTMVHVGYDDFGMNGYEHHADLVQQVVDTENIKNSMRI